MVDLWVATGTDDVSEGPWLPEAAGEMVGMWRWPSKDSIAWSQRSSRTNLSLAAPGRPPYNPSVTSQSFTSRSQEEGWR